MVHLQAPKLSETPREPGGNHFPAPSAAQLWNASQEVTTAATANSNARGDCGVALTDASLNHAHVSLNQAPVGLSLPQAVRAPVWVCPTDV
jgi:hypothetical protein